MRQNLTNFFTKPVHIAPLVTFRIVFGVLMAAGTIRFMALGWVADHYVDPVFHFTYFGFSWVKPMGLAAMYAAHILLVIASIFLALGFFYRLSAILVFLLFTYLELIDLTYYLNHYYFVSLVSFLLIWVPANRYFAMDVWRKPSIFRNVVPAWCVNIFKLQLAIVYIYAGIIKINYDWLINALPLKIWLPANDKLPLIGSLFAWKFTPYLFSWIGMLYDTTIVFFLANKATRVFAYFTVIVFHILTGILFQIGVFPMVMIGATLIFFSEKWHVSVLHHLNRILRIDKGSLLEQKEVVVYEIPQKVKPFLKGMLVLYFIFQFVFPWRFLLYPNNMYWTEQGYRFGWRVMLMEKAGTATFYVKDSKTGREGMVFNDEFLNPHQEKQMAMQPDMILQYAHFLGKHYAAKGIANPKVRAEVYVTLNARPSKLLIDSTVDLMKINDSWKHKSWIADYNNQALKPGIP